MAKAGFSPRHDAGHPHGQKGRPCAISLAERSQSGLDPSDVAAQVLTAISTDELYVFTDAGAEWRAELAERFATILAAMDKAAVPRRHSPPSS